MKTSIPRLRSVRLKSGASLSLIHNDRPCRAMERLADDVRLITDYPAGRLAAGYALVVWGTDGSVASILRVYDSRQLGAAMVPDFVRTQLADDNCRDGVIRALRRP